MLKSGLLRCCLLIALGTIGTWANEDVGKDAEWVLHKVAKVPEDEFSFLRNRFNHAVTEEDNAVKRFVVERIPDPTRRGPKEQAAPALTTPQPTPPPQKRQDDGQIQALSQQLQSLSESATRAISSVSSSASSAMSLVSQSAQFVRQSAIKQSSPPTRTPTMLTGNYRRPNRRQPAPSLRQARARATISRDRYQV